MRFSANLGFLWPELPLPERIFAAAEAGFDAVECHWPYDTPAYETISALRETGLCMLGLNTRRGDPSRGENGLSALPGMEEDARSAIDEAIAYASEIGAVNVHVMAGISEGEAAANTYLHNLVHACEQAAGRNLTILIEPLNPHDAPGYFLRTTDQAAGVIKRLRQPNLRLMFDCYHVQRVEQNVADRLKRLMPIIGHIQIASVPDRGPPDHGELSYKPILDEIAELGFDQPVGAEYMPPKGVPTDQTLGWLSDYRS